MPVSSDYVNSLKERIDDLEGRVRYCERWINWAIGGSFTTGTVIGFFAGPIFSVAKAYLAGHGGG